jgi:acetoin utilization protein AcuB
VVDGKGKLEGIVSERDLMYASPSPATSLTVWEITYLLSKLEVQEIMTKDVITTTADTPIEDAAHLMVEHKIGGLPVVDDQNRVVGIITETDIYRTFVEMFGGGRSGVRLTLEVPERKRVILDLSKAISELDGDIVSVGSFEGAVSGNRRLVIKVQEVGKDQLLERIEALDDQVVDARNV